MSGGEDIIEGALCRIQDGHSALEALVQITISFYRALKTYIGYKLRCRDWLNTPIGRQRVESNQNGRVRGAQAMCKGLT